MGTGSEDVIGATVYIIDDDESVRRSLRRLLSGAGLRPQAFADQSQLIACGRVETGCCLILDLHLGGSASGFDVQRELEQRGVILPIIFLTGFGSVPTAVQAIKSGAVDFLTKPFDTQELLKAVRRAIECDKAKSAARTSLASLRSRFQRLTEREREILAQIVTGRLNKQIAVELGISEKTVKVHRARVMEKLEMDSVADLVRAAEALGVGPHEAQAR